MSSRSAPSTWRPATSSGRSSRRGGGRARAPAQPAASRTPSSPSSAGSCRTCAEADLELVEPPAALARSDHGRRGGRPRGSARCRRRLATSAGSRRDARRSPRRPLRAPIAFPSAAERDARARGPDRPARLGDADRRGHRDRGARRLEPPPAERAERRAAVRPGRRRPSSARPRSPAARPSSSPRARTREPSGIAAVRADGSVVLAMRDLPPTIGEPGLRDVGDRARARPRSRSAASRSTPTGSRRSRPDRPTRRPGRRSR